MPDNRPTFPSSTAGATAIAADVPHPQPGLIAQLRRQIFDLHTVFDIARRFHSVPDTDALLEGILLAAVAQLGVGGAAVIVADPGQEGYLTRCRTKGWDEVVSSDWHLSVDSPVARALVEHQAPIAVDALRARLPGEDPNVALLRRVGCEMVAPIMARGELRGMVCLSGKLSGAAFNSDDRAFLGLLLEQFAVSLDNAQLYESEHQTAAELLRTRERLAGAQKLLALGRLSAAIAHEVRNPLGIIKNYIELIRPVFPPGSAEADRLDVIAAEVSRIDRVLAGILSAFHPRQSTASCVGLGEVIAEVERGIAPQMHERGIAVVVRIPPLLPAVAGDAEPLRQVFLNLALNARDAMTEGGTLSITAETDGDWVNVRFTDEGPGIDPAVQRTLFDPFTTTKDPGKGTGLGLSICQSIVDSFGGSIEAANIPSPGHGAIFTLRLRQAAAGDSQT
jgi:signal transduction histidine kinase